MIKFHSALILMMVSSSLSFADGKPVSKEEFDKKVSSSGNASQKKSNASNLHSNAVGIADNDLQSTVKLFLIKNGHPKYSPEEIDSLFFDSHRWSNDFIDVKKVKYPHRKGVYILESKQEGVSNPSNFDQTSTNGSLEFNNSKPDAQAILIAENTTNTTSFSINADSKNANKHGERVCSRAKGATNLIVGYAADPDDVKCASFDEDMKKINGEFIVHDIPMLEKIDEFAKNRNIISMSFFFVEQMFKDLVGVDLEKTEATRDKLVNAGHNIQLESTEETRKKKELAAKLENKKGDFILLTALQNIDPNKSEDEDGSYSNRAWVTEMKNALGKYSNLFFVSAVEYDANTEKYTNPRYNLSELEFFSVVGNYEYVADSEAGSFKNDEVQTSYETPVLAVILNNIQALSPDLTNEQIKELLKKTASNVTADDRKQIGYVVNPKKAYEFTVGSLLANSQRKYYKNCQNATVTPNIDLNANISWKVDCSQPYVKKKDVVDFNYANVDFLSGFFDNAIINSEGKGRIKTNYRKHSSVTPDVIEIKDVVVDYQGNKIKVDYNKRSDSQDGFTQKLSLIQYFKEIEHKERGKPSLIIENVITLAEKKGEKR
jgi:hypothetical protein